MGLCCICKLYCHEVCVQTSWTPYMQEPSVATQTSSEPEKGFKKLHIGRGGLATYRRMCSGVLSVQPTGQAPDVNKALACDVMQKVHIDLIGPFPTSKRATNTFSRRFAALQSI